MRVWSGLFIGDDKSVEKNLCGVSSCCLNLCRRDSNFQATGQARYSAYCMPLCKVVWEDEKKLGEKQLQEILEGIDSFFESVCGDVCKRLRALQGKAPCLSTCSKRPRNKDAERSNILCQSRVCAWRLSEFLGDIASGMGVILSPLFVLDRSLKTLSGGIF
jgi:hypothetical protein